MMDNFSLNSNYMQVDRNGMSSSCTYPMGYTTFQNSQCNVQYNSTVSSSQYVVCNQQPSFVPQSFFPFVPSATSLPPPSMPAPAVGVPTAAVPVYYTTLPVQTYVIVQSTPQSSNLQTPQMSRQSSVEPMYTSNPVPSFVPNISFNSDHSDCMDIQFEDKLDISKCITGVAGKPCSNSRTAPVSPRSESPRRQPQYSNSYPSSPVIKAQRTPMKRPGTYRCHQQLIEEKLGQVKKMFHDVIPADKSELVRGDCCVLVMAKKNRALCHIVPLLAKFRQSVKVKRASFPLAGKKGKRGFLCFIEVFTKKEVETVKKIFTDFNESNDQPFREITDAPDNRGKPRVPKNGGKTGNVKKYT